MQLRNPHRPERSDEESFAMVAEAGFDGLCLDPSVEEITENLDKRPLFEAHGLGCMVNAFPYSPGDMEPLLDFANDMNACMVNVISGVMPVKPEEAVPVVLDWIGTAERKRMPLLFETHRDGLLNDLYFTLQLMELVPEMRLCSDLSHFVVDRELRAPVPDRDEQFIQARS
jgi:sugar phosphate isomerase/epimerase